MDAVAHEPPQLAPADPRATLMPAARGLQQLPLADHRRRRASGPVGAVAQGDGVRRGAHQL
eukprot:858595-Pyramimonas_sp.AAC.1